MAVRVVETMSMIRGGEGGGRGGGGGERSGSIFTDGNVEAPVLSDGPLDIIFMQVCVCM